MALLIPLFYTLSHFINQSLHFSHHLFEILIVTKIFKNWLHLSDSKVTASCSTDVTRKMAELPSS